MSRQFTLSLVVSTCAVLGAGLGPFAERGTGTDLDKLKQERIELLQKRIDIVKEFIATDRAGVPELVDTKIDLLSAKIEYAKSNNDRRRLYDDLLKNYDMKIEAGGTRENALTLITKELDLLYLKSERIRIQIERDSLK